MKFSKVKKVSKKVKNTYDITVEKNHNFFCNGFLIHNSDYRGDIMAPLINMGNHYITFKRGERVAQMVFKRVPYVKLEEGEVDTKTIRSTGGFGSTGR